MTAYIKPIASYRDANSGSLQQPGCSTGTRMTLAVFITMGCRVRFTDQQLRDYRARQHAGTPTAPEGDSDEPESKLTNRIEQWCLDRGYPHFHDRSRKKNRAGWLDHVVCLPGGRTIYIEDKSKRGRLKPEQRATYMALKALGHEAYIIKTWKQFIEIVSEKEAA